MITCDEDVLGGEPRIADTRVAVRHVAPRVVEHGQSVPQVADQLDLSLAEVYAALSYYYEHIDEMRRFERADRAAFERVAESSLQPPKAVK